MNINIRKYFLAFIILTAPINNFSSLSVYNSLKKIIKKDCLVFTTIFICYFSLLFALTKNVNDINNRAIIVNNFFNKTLKYNCYIFGTFLIYAIFSDLYYDIVYPNTVQRFLSALKNLNKEPETMENFLKEGHNVNQLMKYGDGLNKSLRKYIFEREIKHLLLNLTEQSLNLLLKYNFEVRHYWFNYSKNIHDSLLSLINKEFKKNNLTIPILLFKNGFGKNKILSKFIKFPNNRNLNEEDLFIGKNDFDGYDDCMKIVRHRFLIELCTRMSKKCKENLEKFNIILTQFNPELPQPIISDAPQELIKLIIESKENKDLQKQNILHDNQLNLCRQFFKYNKNSDYVCSILFKNNNFLMNPLGMLNLLKEICLQTHHPNTKDFIKNLTFIQFARLKNMAIQSKFFKNEIIQNIENQRSQKSIMYKKQTIIRKNDQEKDTFQLEHLTNILPLEITMQILTF